MDGAPKPRDIRESEVFQAQKSAIEPNVRRLDEALDGLIFFLARRPDIVDPIPGTSVRRLIIRMHPIDPRPRLRVWYRYDSNCVYLEGIERID